MKRPERLRVADLANIDPMYQPQPEKNLWQRKDTLKILPCERGVRWTPHPVIVTQRDKGDHFSPLMFLIYHYYRVCGPPKTGALARRYLCIHHDVGADDLIGGQPGMKECHIGIPIGNCIGTTTGIHPL